MFLWIGLLITGLADGLITPTSVAYVAKLAPDEYRALGMAIYDNGFGWRKRFWKLCFRQYFEPYK